MTSREQRWRPWVLGGVVLLIVGSVVVAAGAVAGAAAARDDADAAMRLRHAAMEVAHADEIRILGGEPDPEALGPSVEHLAADHSAALSALDPVDAKKARELLDEIVGCGLDLLDPEADGPKETHDHDELQRLATAATRGAAQRAADSERAALVASGSGGAALLVGAWMLVGARHRRDRERSKAEVAVREQRRLRTLLDESPDDLFVVDRSGRVVHSSRADDSALGGHVESIDDLVRLASDDRRAELRQLLEGTSIASGSGVHELRGGDGRSRWFEIRVTDLTDDEFVDGHLVAARDVTNETVLRRDLQLEAITDSLTGLANRRILPVCLDAAQEDVVRTGAAAAALSLDIDGFKSVNDVAGHAAGDELLVEVADRLRASAPPGADVVRVGGDEFTIILRTTTEPDEPLRAAHALLAALREPFSIGERVEHLRTSIGVAIAAEPDEVDDLILRSDIAMFEAKRRGGATVVVHDAAIEAATARSAEVIRALRNAHHDSEFSLSYQPIVVAETERTVALEALLRWDSPTLGAVSPGEFIPLAELCGEICEIGRWVLEKVVRQMSQWIEAGIDPDLRVSFNVSALQLAEEPFVPTVVETAERWGVPSNRIVVEVTETVALDDSGLAQQTLGRLREAGFRIAIDDFGAGYSNLGKLLGVPFDIIKIDRSLLLTLAAMREQSGNDPTGPCAIMEAIVSIASILDAPVVCEGVETEQQLQSLRSSGVTHVQGYLTGRPAPPEDLAPRHLFGHTAAAVPTAASTSAST